MTPFYFNLFLTLLCVNSPLETLYFNSFDLLYFAIVDYYSIFT